MNKERGISVALLLVFVLLAALNFNLISELVEMKSVTGLVSTTGAIKLSIAVDINILIQSPENITYEFNLSDGDYNAGDGYYYYILDLNVTSDNDAEEWRYSVYNEGDMMISQEVFAPNTHVAFRSGFNEVIVYASNVVGNWYSAGVNFTIEILESSPILNVSSKYYGCEGEKFSTYFEIIDYDGNLKSVDVLPRDLFFARIISSIRNPIFDGEFFSNGEMQKDDVGSHLKTVYAIDTSDLQDSKQVDFEILEINEIPSVENLNVFKIWMKGMDKTFSENWSVYDVEDGLSFDGNLTFDLSFANGGTFGLFDIDENGSMFFEGDQFSPPGVYPLKVCVEDNPILNLHENITEICGSNGSSNVVCDEFALTISNDSRAPEIISFEPDNINVNMTDEVYSVFNVSVFDADGDALYIVWSVDDVEIQTNISYADLDYHYFDLFNYSFGCGIGGQHNVSVFVDDSILNTSMIWYIDVEEVSCPVIIEGVSGGGGGGGANYCFEKWACQDWSVCQNVELSLNNGVLSLDDYYLYKDQCNQLGYMGKKCGYHIRECVDGMNCSNIIPRINKSAEAEICYFVVRPRCNDGVKNCHDGFCEIGIDCGGGCDACPTCNDGKMNQGEAGIDCGGPCPDRCGLESPNAINWLVIFLFLILFIIISFIIFMIIILFKRRKEEEEDDRDTRLKSVLNQNKK